MFEWSYYKLEIIFFLGHVVTSSVFLENWMVGWCAATCHFIMQCYIFIKNKIYLKKPLEHFSLITTPIMVTWGDDTTSKWQLWYDLIMTPNEYLKPWFGPVCLCSMNDHEMMAKTWWPRHSFGDPSQGVMTRPWWHFMEGVVMT